MRRLFIILLLVPSHLMASTFFIPNASPIYRFKNSPFDSGQINSQILEKNIVKTEADLTFQAIFQNGTYMLEPNDFATEHSVLTRAMVKNSTKPSPPSLLKEPIVNSQVTQPLNPGEIINITEATPHWSHAVTSSGKSGWIKNIFIESLNNDVGTWMTGEDVFLRSFPKKSAEIVTTIPKLTRLNLQKHSMKTEWAPVTYNSLTGYVSVKTLIHRSQFAMWAYHPKHSWFMVKERKFPFLISASKISVPIHEVTGYIPHPQKAVIVRYEHESLPLLSTVIIEKKINQEWAMSLIPGHGHVWWQKASNTDFSQDKHKNVPIDEILKKKVFAYDFSTHHHKIKGILSAHGVYISKDGYLWQSLEPFKNENLSVKIHPSGALIVGSFISHDGGITFQDYIRWDKLTEAIQKNTHYPPQYLKIEKLLESHVNDIRLRISTGHQSFNVKTNFGENDWEVVRN